MIASNGKCFTHSRVEYDRQILSGGESMSGNARTWSHWTMQGEMCKDDDERV
jgi:hypothetical protein